MTKRLKNYIGGEWVESNATNYIPVHNPATCEILAECPDSTYEDVDQAVQAATEAFDEWRETPILSRAQYMHHFKIMLEDRFEEISRIVVEENGKTMDEARGEPLCNICRCVFSLGAPEYININISLYVYRYVYTCMSEL